MPWMQALEKEKLKKKKNEEKVRWHCSIHSGFLAAPTSVFRALTRQSAMLRLRRRPPRPPRRRPRKRRRPTEAKAKRTRKRKST
jgi:hypothetical protein